MEERKEGKEKKYEEGNGNGVSRKEIKEFVEKRNVLKRKIVRNVVVDWREEEREKNYEDDKGNEMRSKEINEENMLGNYCPEKNKKEKMSRERKKMIKLVKTE